MLRKMIMMAAVMAVLPFAAAKEKTDSEGLRVMSYNIRLGSANDGTNSWALRYPATAVMLEDQKPDVFGVQEALDYQVRFIEEMCGYESVGVGRDNGKKEGEFISIFWNKKKVSMLKWGTLWLSETPDVPSKGWDAECKRTATWALMKDKVTGNRFFFVNTHLDHVGVEARKKGLELILDHIGRLNPDAMPVVLAGDFNVTPDDPVLKELDKVMTSARKDAVKTDNSGTYHNWGKASDMIDHIYFSGFSLCSEFQTVTKKYSDRKFISDHYPVTAVLIF